MGLEFRGADAGDIGVLAGIHADNWQRHYRGSFTDEFLDGPVVQDRLTVWTERLTHPDPRHRTIVAVDAGTIVGFAHTSLDDDPIYGALLDNLHVVFERAGQGLGRRLMDRTARAVLDHRPDSGLYLWVLEKNTAAQAFYAALSGLTVEHVVDEPHGGGGPVVGTYRIHWPDPAVLLLDLSPGPE